MESLTHLCMADLSLSLGGDPATHHLSSLKQEGQAEEQLDVCAQSLSCFWRALVL